MIRLRHITAGICASIILAVLIGSDPMGAATACELQIEARQ